MAGRPGAAERLLVRLIEDIRRHRWRPGEAIPTERAFVRTHRVARVTVRSVLEKLERKGLVMRRGRQRVAGTPAILDAAAERPVLVLSISADDPRSRYLVDSGSDVSLTAGAVLALQAARTPYHLSSTASGSGGHDLLAWFNPRGAIVISGIGPNPDASRLFERLRARGTPVVGVGEVAAAQITDEVDSDHQAGGGMLAAALAVRGRRLLVLEPEATAGQPLPRWWQRRLHGITVAANAAGVEPERCAVPYPDLGDLSARAFAHAVRATLGWLMPAMLPVRPTPAAILASNDSVAVVVAEALRLLGLDPDRDLVVAGYDHMLLDHLGRHTSWLPPITVDKRNGLIGARASAMLDERLAGLAGPGRHELVAPVLLRRR